MSATHLAGQQLPEHNPKGEDVCLLAVWFVLNHFRGHPAVRACLGSHVAGANDASDAEVSNLQAHTLSLG